MSVTSAETQTLLAGSILVSGMAALVWVAMALIARIAPRASLAMAGANAAVSLALALHALRSAQPGTAICWASDVSAVGAFTLLGTAVSGITQHQLRWRAGACTAAVAALALLALPYTGDMLWQTRIVTGVGAGLALAAGTTAWRALSRRTDGHRTPAPLALPLFLIAGLMAARCVETAVNPGSTADMRVPTAFNLVFLWAALVLMLLQNATLAFLVLMRLILRIERLLERDPLTGTLNRRAFDQALEHAHAWLARGRCYALVMIDMDRFKQLNDTLGHAAGDAALRQMVQELQPCVREVDRFGRLGGEEFCVLLPDTDIAGAALVAERMRMLVDAAPLRWLEQDWPLSASFGIAEAERGDESASAVMARADAALYRAKHQGRNVVQA